MEKETKYKDGMDMRQFKCLHDISFYNNNYYVGFDKDLLFGKSDDDDTTEWFIVTPYGSTLLGYSLTSNKDLLEKTDIRRT